MNFLELIWLIPLFPLAGAAAMLFFGRQLDPQAASGLAVAEGVPHVHDDEHSHHHGHGHHHHEHEHHSHGHSHSHDQPGHSHDAHGHSHHHGSPLKKIVTLFCPGMVLLSFLFSLGAVVQLAALPERTHQVIQFTWLAGLPVHLYDGRVAAFTADWGFLLDPLSAVMILVVTGIGFLIHVYSTGYMAHDGGYYRFFGYLNLFVFFMLMLVLANNYVLLFVGWEGVGLCSYLLIGFYFHKKSAGDAGKKAFIVNRVGDSGFILGMLLLFSITGTLRFDGVRQALSGLQPEHEFGLLSAAALLLFIGATGKSAQFPLHVWLPDAMEGPTPVSALIHAATMVTAGVYMVARSSPLFSLAPETLRIVAVTGAFTAILAASIALAQNDIKRVLAYSTVSQLGYMVLALGVGAYWVAVFHLYTHAFFKALLFLGSGSVIHSLSGEQDMRRMGGLKDKIPVTFKTMLVGSLAIAGIPGLAGFFSKDEILWQAWSSPLGAKALWTVGFVTAAMTAFYMFRMMYMTFYGPSRVAPEAAGKIHESPRSMTLPLVVLAAGSVLAGWIGVPKLWSFLPDSFRAFEHWLEPAFVSAAAHGAEASHETSVEWMLMLLSIGVAVAGILTARYFYLTRPEIPESVAASAGPLYKAVLNKWYLDEIYDFLFVNGLAKGGGRLSGAFDRNVIDGGVNGAGWLTRFTSTLSIWWDTWIIDGAVRLSSFSVKIASYPARIIQSGQLQTYALWAIGGIILFFGYYMAGQK